MVLDSDTSYGTSERDDKMSEVDPEEKVEELFIKTLDGGSDTEMSAGDIAFIPPGWIHHVKNKEVGRA